ncbi:MAG: hypothetical protein GY751_26220 [Bacteroidetes bacterium]|jgi:hypothetical protein|nr:hypothetical protein [Bacteroidota bacterium]
MNRNEFCPICDGAVPSEEYKGQFPGALSRYDNNEEICSLCGMAEAMTPFFSTKGMSLMRLGLDMQNFEVWADGVRLGLPQCRELLEQQKAAHEQLKKLNEEE